MHGSVYKQSQDSESTFSCVLTASRAQPMCEVTAMLQSALCCVQQQHSNAQKHVSQAAVLSKMSAVA